MLWCGGRRDEFKEGKRDHIITLMVLFAGFILLILLISLVLAWHSGLYFGHSVALIAFFYFNVTD